MTALAWLNDLVQWFGRWIPRLVLIHPTHRGVRFGPTGRAVQVGPGLVGYWPMTHDLVQIPVTTRSIQLTGEILPTTNPESVIVPRVIVVSLNLQFAITDPVTAAVRALHFQALLANRAMAFAQEAWRSTPETDRGEMSWIHEAEERLRMEMTGYGIDVLALDVAGFGTGVVVKTIGDANWQDSGKRDE